MNYIALDASGKIAGYFFSNEADYAQSMQSENPHFVSVHATSYVGDVVGKLYDPVTDTVSDDPQYVSPPSPPPIVIESWEISKRAFIKRLGSDYWLDLEDASVTIRDLRKLVLLFNNSTYINLQDSDVIAGVSAALNPAMPTLLQKTQAEVDAILLTPCQTGEGP